MKTSGTKICLGLFTISGFVSSFIAWRYIRESELNKLENRFVSLGLATSNKIFRTNLISVNDADVANFVTVEGTDSLNRVNYDNFTELSLSFGPGSIAETTFHPRVLVGDIDSFIARYQDEYGDEVSFDRNDEIWPTLYQFPMNDNRLGLDIYSDERTKGAVDFMISVQDNAVTKRIIQDGVIGIRSLQPSFKNGQIIGCVSKDISIESSIVRAFANARALDSPRRSEDDVLAYELLSLPDLRIRAYLNTFGEGGEMMYDSEGLEIVDGIPGEDAQIFIDSPGKTYEFENNLDDVTTLHFIVKARVETKKTTGLIALLSIALATVAIVYIGHTWRRLLSQRGKALDIAILESEHKSKFVSEISHEFRTPLNGIIGVLDLLRTEDTSKHVKKYTSIANSCSKIMLGLVNDILDFSKLQSGNMKIVRCPVHLRGFVHETMNIVRATKSRLDEKMFLVMNIDESVPDGVFEMDDIRVRQVLINLLSNALKFTKTGSVTTNVSVSHDNVPPGDIRVHMDVVDTGIGMSEEGVSNLFKAFSQVHNAREVKAGGTGLGLVICKKLCRDMGGDVTCTSIQGKGTTFSFNVVIGEPHVLKKGDPTSMSWDLSTEVELEDHEYVMDIPSKPVYDKLSSYFTKRSENTKRPSIIVADDVNVNQLLFDRMMAPLGAVLYQAKDGAELVKMCSNVKFSIILTDIVMPVLSGSQASRLIATGSGPNKNTPIIAISGSVLEEGGMTVDSIMKPIGRKTLYDKLSKWLSDEEVSWIHANNTIVD